MILLWGVPGDPPMDAVHAALLNMGAEVAFVDQRMNSQTIVELHPTRTGPLAGRIEAPDANIDVLNISCAYIRPVETAKAAGVDNGESVACRRAMLADMALIAWADMCNCTRDKPAALHGRESLEAVSGNVDSGAWISHPANARHD